MHRRSETGRVIRWIITTEEKVSRKQCWISMRAQTLLDVYKRQIVDLLKEQQMTVSTVEACTGGMISARLTDVPGCSEVFRQGFVTYSDRAKRKMVGVKKSTLKKYTAVSEQTAKEMAKGGAFMAE